MSRPGQVERLLAEATRLQSSGRHEEAIARYDRALEASLPAGVALAVHYNRGAALRQAGRTDEALAAFVRALAIDAGDGDAWVGLGLCCADRGEPALAVQAHRRAVDLGGGAMALVHLGNALRAAGCRHEAAEAYREALERDPGTAAASYNLHAALYDERDPGPALEALETALRSHPDHPRARFFRHAIRRWHGLGTDDRLDENIGFLASSLDFALEARSEDTRAFSDTFATLDWAVSLAPPSGPVVELGVRRGTTLCHLAARFPEREIHGVDSFAGLPEAWGEQSPGLYSTGGELPVVPDHVALHPGWFRDVLPPLARRLDGPISLLHVDCDLYSSTHEALETLAPRLGTGTVVVFDEYLCNPGWPDEEHRAWLEAAARHRWRYRYAAFSLFTKQAVVVIA